jgi:hypothetical protein
VELLTSTKKKHVETGLKKSVETEAKKPEDDKENKIFVPHVVGPIVSPYFKPVPEDTPSTAADSTLTNYFPTQASRNLRGRRVLSAPRQPELSASRVE